MANKTLRKERIRKNDIIKQVKIILDKNAFNGPFQCHNKTTVEIIKTMKLIGLELNYGVWGCIKCKKEYLDLDQSKRLERIWAIEKLVNSKGIEIERVINFDGQTYFLRFPKDITKNWKRESKAEIIVLSPDEFFVKIVPNSI